jgi:hypothetical protein
MKSYKLRVYEQRNKNPQNLEEFEENRVPISIKLERADRMIKGVNVDECLQQAKLFVEKKLRRKVRTVSIGPAGIFVIVYKRGK